MFEDRRVDKAENYLEWAQENNRLIFILRSSGHLDAKVISKDEQIQKGLHNTNDENQIYLYDDQQYANPVRIDFDREDVEGHIDGDVGGLVPSTEWRMFRDQKVVEEAFNKKKALDLDWTWVIVGISALLVLLGAAWMYMGGA